jgi:hypothetical protein
MAGPSYNLVAGLGTPVADRLVPDLVAWAGGPVSATPVGPITAADLVWSGNGSGGGTIDALVQAGLLRAFSAVTPGAGNGNDAAPLVAAAFPGTAAQSTAAVSGRSDSPADGTGSNSASALRLSWYTAVPGATEAVSRPPALGGGAAWAPGGIETLPAPLAPALPVGTWLRADGSGDGNDVLPGDDLWVGWASNRSAADGIWEALAAGARLTADTDSWAAASDW